MSFRIPPGSPLDTALNVLIAAQAGENAPGWAMEHDVAVQLVDAAAALDHDNVMAALGVRAAMCQLGDEVPVRLGAPLAQLLPAAEIERRWFGGRAAA